LTRNGLSGAGVEPRSLCESCVPCRVLSSPVRHQPSLDHVLQELVAELRNGLITARRQFVSDFMTITPQIRPAVLEPEDAGRGVGRDMLTVLDLRYVPVLIAENLNSFKLIASSSSIQTAELVSRFLGAGLRLAREREIPVYAYSRAEVLDAFGAPRPPPNWRRSEPMRPGFRLGCPVNQLATI
jgi:hypothetical protein